MDNTAKQLIEWPEQDSSTPITLVFTDMVGSSAAKRASTLGADAAARDEPFSMWCSPAICTWSASAFPLTTARRS